MRGATRRRVPVGGGLNGRHPDPGRARDRGVPGVSDRALSAVAWAGSVLTGAVLAWAFYREARRDPVRLNARRP